MREKDEPQFRIEGFSEDPLEREKEIEDLIKKRNEIFNELKKVKQNTEEDKVELLDTSKNQIKSK